MKTLWILIFFLLFLHPNMNRPPLLAVVFGTGFGSGFWPWGPGTAGALLASLMWLSMIHFFSPTALFLLTLALIVLGTIIGTWATNQLEPFWGPDPKRVVIDEMVGVWIPLLISPTNNIWFALGAFGLFRFFDILKPLGIRQLDQRQGGFWVMADDILAGIYSLIVLAIIQWAI